MDDSSPRRSPWRRVGVLALVIVIAAGALISAVPVVNALRGRAQEYSFHGATAEPPIAVPGFALTNERGESVRLTDFRGQLVLLYFGYTSCPDACPLTLQDLARARKLLGADGDRARVFLVTVDPERDTPERLASYLKLFDPTFGGLTGSPEALSEVYQVFGVRAEKDTSAKSAAGYLVGHTSLTYVIDPQGRLRLAYPLGITPEEIAADLRVLLRSDGRKT